MSSARARAVPQLLARLYRGPRWWDRLQPDRLAETLIGLELLAEQGSLFHRGLPAATPGQVENAVTMLAQAAVHQPDLDDILIRAADIAGVTVGVAALTVAPRSEPSAPLLALLARLADTADHDTLRELAARLPRASTVLAPAAAAITAALTASYRRLAEAAPDAYLPDLARSLSNLAASLAKVGRREQALAPAQEAVTIRRRLAEAAPDAYLPDLANSLNNLAVLLAEVGRREQALAPAQEAADLYRRLAEAALLRRGGVARRGHRGARRRVAGRGAVRGVAGGRGAPSLYADDRRRAEELLAWFESDSE